VSEEMLLSFVELKPVDFAVEYSMEFYKLSTIGYFSVSKKKDLASK